MQALTVLLSLALAAPRLVSGQGQGGAATVTGTLGAATTTTQNGLGDSTTTTLVNNGNSNSTSLTRTTSATASRTATTTLSATTTAASNGGDGVQCVFLKGSQHCPSYAAYAIDANSLVLKQEAQGQTGVAAFDIMIENWASAGPRSIFSQATCSIWDPSQVRYADQFFCDYFVYDPFVYGDPTTPNAIKDCNLFLTGNSIESTSPSFNSRLYPRISNTTCSAFYESMFDYISDCDGSTVSGRQSVKDTVSNACLVAVQAVQAGSPAIDMLKDTSSEALNCGFGMFQGNVTRTLQEAYNYCLSTGHPPTDPCCTADPTLANALNKGIIPGAIQDVYNCQLSLSGGAYLTCGQVIGASSGFIMGCLSLFIVWWGVKQQDQDAMRNTASYQDNPFQKWFRNSPFSASSKQSAADDAALAAYHNSQQQQYQKDRQYQFVNSQRRSHSARRPSAGGVPGDNTYRSMARDGRSNSRSPIRGVDPFAEMMGGNPAQSPPPSDSIPTYRAMFEFYGTRGTMEMDVVKAGDRLILLEVRGGGVAVARNLDTGRQGLVPLNILAR